MFAFSAHGRGSKIGLLRKGNLSGAELFSPEGPGSQIPRHGLCCRRARCPVKQPRRCAGHSSSKSLEGRKWSSTPGSLCCCRGVLHLRCRSFFLTLVAFVQPGRRGLQRVCSSVPEARATPQQREGAARPCIVCCLGSFSVQTCYSFVVKTRLEMATGYSLKFWIRFCRACAGPWLLSLGSAPVGHGWSAAHPSSTIGP